MLTLLLAFAVPIESYAKSGVAILAHDVVRDPVIASASRAVTASDSVPSRNRTVSFSAFGNRYVLDLQPNDRLIAGVLPSLNRSTSTPGVYQGTIASRPDTWARIAIDESQNISGAIWDGGELLILDQAARLYGTSDAGSGMDKTLAVKGSDVRVAIADGVGAEHGSQIRSLNELYTASRAQRNATAVSRAISIGLVLGDEYVGFAKTRAIQRSIELTNIADGIFVSQLAVHLNIEFIRAFDQDAPDPFTTSDPSSLLQQMAELKQSDPDLAPMGLVHLFTRTDLDGDTRGIARLSSYCAPNKGVGLTEGIGSAIDALIMAHEIGHNFGARHDGVSGEGCGSTPQTFLMAPEISGSNIFSQCSVDKMMQTLSSVSCLTTVPASEISLSPPVLPSAVLYGEQHSFEYVVTNIGLESALDSSLIVATEDNVELQSNGSPDRPCGTAGPQPNLRCDLQSLHAGESVTVGYSFVARQVGDIRLDAFASASNDVNPSNNEVRSTVRVVEATDLMPSVNEVREGSANVKAGQPVDYLASVSNRGDFASAATVTISTTYNHSLSTSDACTAINEFTLRCELGTLQPGSASSINFTVHTDASMNVDPTEFIAGEVLLHVDGSTADYAPENNDAQLSFVMWGTIKNLYAELTELPVSINVNESGAFRGTFGNHGPDAAANVRASIQSLGSGVQIDNVVLEKGSCTRLDLQHFDCELGVLESGETTEFSATYTGNAAGDHEVQIDLREDLVGFEANADDNRVNASFKVASPPSPEPPVASVGTRESGGGSLVWTLIFALLLAVRRLYDQTLVFSAQAGQHDGRNFRQQLARSGLRPAFRCICEGPVFHICATTRARTTALLRRLRCLVPVPL